MKTIVLIVLLASSLSATAQRVRSTTGSITVIADTMSVSEAFAFSDRLLPKRNRYYDRYVIKNKTLYYRAGIGLFRKSPIYKYQNGSFVKLHK